MTRVLIPRSDNTSAKIIEASDFERYFEDFMNDYVICGFEMSAQCPNILTVNVEAGTARVNGLYVENTTQCSVSCLTACSTNYIYATICRDPQCEPQGWIFSKNTTGTKPACSVFLGVAITGASTVTSTNQNNIVIRPLKIIPTNYGDGSDGCATNPVVSAGTVKNYTCLTIACNTTWGASGNGPIIVYVQNTLALNACTTLTISTTNPYTVCDGGTSDGGTGGVTAGTPTPTPVNGGAGGKGKGHVVIIAKNVTGTGTLTATGQSGNNGGQVNSFGNTSPGAQPSGNPGSKPQTWGEGLRATPPTGGNGGEGSNGAGTSPGGNGGSGAGGNVKIITSRSTHVIAAGGGAGGGAGAAGNTGGAGGGGGGGSVGWAIGGNGGNGGNSQYSGSVLAGGGGGGGGGGLQFTFVSGSILPGITLNLSGGAGGNGGDGWNSGCSKTGGGGGGGGGAAHVIIVTADGTEGSATVNVSGGTAGSVGAVSGGNATITNGNPGNSGGSKYHLFSTADFIDNAYGYQ